MWKITVNGILLGTYPNESYARMAFTGVCQDRPKNRYKVDLHSPDGAIVSSKETSVKMSKKEKERAADKK